MVKSSFLARKSFGLSNYLWIALVVALLAAIVPYAVHKAVRSNSNRAEDWLPANFPESFDLRWFRDHFSSGSFLACSWEGCTLGDDEQLICLVEKLSRWVLPSESDPLGEPNWRHAKAAVSAGDYWFRRLVSGPSVIEKLTSAPLNLSYRAAAERLEGTLVGPRQLDAEGNPLGDDSRQTCLVIYLAPSGYSHN